jgi:hypothetical protein
MKYKEIDYFYENIKVGQQFSCFDTTGDDKITITKIKLYKNGQEFASGTNTNSSFIFIDCFYFQIFRYYIELIKGIKDDFIDVYDLELTVITVEIDEFLNNFIYKE